MHIFPVLANKDDDGIIEDYRNEQAYFNQEGAIPRDKDGLTSRFTKIYDSPDCTTYDCLIVDRTTGKIVTRYDAVDPANTRFDYGAKNDGEVLADLGYDIKEMVDPSLIIMTNEKLSALVTSHCLGCSSCDGSSSYDDYDDYEDQDDDWMESEEVNATPSIKRKFRFVKRTRTSHYEQYWALNQAIDYYADSLKWAGSVPIFGGVFHKRSTRRYLNKQERLVRNLWEKKKRLKEPEDDFYN